MVSVQYVFEGETREVIMGEAELYLLREFSGEGWQDFRPDDSMRVEYLGIVWSLSRKRLLNVNTGEDNSGVRALQLTDRGRAVLHFAGMG